MLHFPRMSREEILRRAVAMLATVVIVGCGGETSGAAHHFDVGNGASGGAPGDASGSGTTGGFNDGSATGAPGSGGAAGVEAGAAGGGTASDAGQPPCCSADSECGGEAVAHCVNSICVPATSGGCWRDADCPNGQKCEGALVCGCASDCSYSTRPGKCVPLPSGCCQKDADCGDFVYEPCVNGVCKTTTPGGCWTSAECRNGASCIGAFVCGCAARCSQGDTLGTCGRVADGG